MSEEATNQPKFMSVDRELGIEIIDGVWAVGEARALEEIQERFNVSRTVAREAARQLEAMGLARPRRRLGLVAQPQENWRMLHPVLINWRLHSTQRMAQMRAVVQLRQAVEPMAAANAARIAPIPDRGRLMSLAAEMRQFSDANDEESFIDCDNEFHEVMLACSGNELFAALGELVGIIIRARVDFDAPHPARQPTIIAHEAVAEAIFKGDADGAHAAMSTLLSDACHDFSGVNISLPTPTEAPTTPRQRPAATK
ncbi:FadR/GntR family transcriptional regulator [Propionibacterium freudenreichii]|uniref:FadR/GntR family transcriptional regulator n=1 Tax=Propionibacterium freudenreichii TaxID=1744 RepID=UPI000BC33FA6|nr:FCD domain-containing protein [Propionibacterium freudenreichii]MCT2973414.1 FadR family transcriptional regulator [Propionibacterium freudenreichii]SBM43916.1 GntR domain protein [Propionibacterium freudenreichii]